MNPLQVYMFFDLRPNYGEDNEENGISFKRSRVCTAILSAPDPAAGRCRPTPPPGPPGHPQASLGQSLWGHCPFLLGPGAHKLLFVPSKSVSPVLCSGGSMVGLMATSS